MHALAGEDMQRDGNRLIVYAAGRLLLAKMQEAGIVPLFFPAAHAGRSLSGGDPMNGFSV